MSLKFLIDLSPEVRVSFLKTHEIFREAVQSNAFTFDNGSRSALKSIRHIHVPHWKTEDGREGNLHAKCGGEDDRCI